MEPICYIAGAGDVCSQDIEMLLNRSSEDYIIAADGGLKKLLDAEIIPHLVIGDFDSCDKNVLNHLPEEVEVIQLNPIKNHTDLHSAVMQGIQRGYENFVIYGATGGRIDHTLANIQLLTGLAKDELSAKIMDATSVYQVVVDNCLTLPARDPDGRYISIFSLSDRSEGVTLANLKYPLTDATLTNSFALGVSNEFIGKDCSDAIIKVMNGALLVISPRG